MQDTTKSILLTSKSIQSPVAKLAMAWTVYRQRAELAQLDTKALHDIGITNAQRDCEIQRGFWDF